MAAGACPAPGVALGPGHRRWLAVNALAATAAINALVNAGIAWATSTGERSVPLVSIPLLQRPSTLTDTLGTLFILPFLTTLLATMAVRRDQRRGRLAPLRLSFRHAGALTRLPSGLLRRAFIIGAGCLSLLGPLCVVVLVMTGFAGITQLTFVLYKAVFGVSLGILVTPPIALAAMADDSPRPAV